jgi:WD40 repeat protein
VWHLWTDHWRPWEGAETPERLGYVDWHQSVIGTATPSGVALWNDSFDLLPWRLEGGPTTAIRHAVFHPDGRHLLTGDADGEVAVWEVGSWRELRRWQAHGRPIRSLVIAANGTRMLTAAADEVAVVWNPLTGEEISSIRGMQARGQIGLSPDGQAVIATPRNKLFADEIEVSDAGTGDSLQIVKPVQFGIQTPPAWTRDGSRVGFIDQSGALTIFDTKTWKRIAALGKTKYAQPDVTAAWFSDNRRLITAGWGKDEIHLLEVASAAPVLTLNAGGGRTKCVALHPGEEWFAVCGDSMPVQLWHLPTSRLVKSWQLGPPEGQVSQVAFSPDGHYLATVNGNGTVYVLSLDGIVE